MMKKKHRKYLVTTETKIYLFIIQVLPNIQCPDIPNEIKRFVKTYFLLNKEGIIGLLLFINRTTV